jgi:2-dehydro-3-deoxygluconokinase
MSKKVVTLGEIMLRLSTPGFSRFVQSDSLDVTYGGGEANVAVALCNYGLDGVFVTKVPDNAIGQSAINHIRRYGVDTQFIARGGKTFGYLLFRNRRFHARFTGYLRPRRRFCCRNGDQ